MPGAFTPTEILTAWEAGADVVKVFPAEVGGPPYLKAVRGPLPQVRLMPTGGVDLSTAEAFLKAGACCLGVGSSLGAAEADRDGRFRPTAEAGGGVRGGGEAGARVVNGTFVMDRTAENACLQGDAASEKSGIGPFVSFLKPAGEAARSGLADRPCGRANWFNTSIIILSYFLTAAVLGFRHAGRGVEVLGVAGSEPLSGACRGDLDGDGSALRGAKSARCPEYAPGRYSGDPWPPDRVFHTVSFAWRRSSRPGHEPRFRVLPRSTRDWMEVILFLGTSIGFVRWVSDLL